MTSRIKNEDVIELLKSRAGFVSGAEIAEALGVTRAAIWKKIKLLIKTGYAIESSPAKGYKLLKSPEFSIEEIRKSLSVHSRTIGKQIIFFETVGSTNTAAMGFAEKGYPDGTVIIADAQTRGKGRLGRTWVSPPGKNLYMSVILKPEIPPTDATILTLMTAVACASAVKKLTSIPVSIKWPNDLIVGNKKLCGILTEIRADMDRISTAVIGIGININLETQDMPDDIKTLATSIKLETGEPQSRTVFAVEILKGIDKWYDVLIRLGKKIIIEEWLQLSSTIGQTVTVTTGNTVLTGIAEGIDNEGMLILKLPDASFKKISAGDLTVLRTASS